MIVHKYGGIMEKYWGNDVEFDDQQPFAFAFSGLEAFMPPGWHLKVPPCAKQAQHDKRSKHNYSRLVQ
jgi:hypothetical protein